MVLAIGEILWDIMPDNQMNLGGAPFNFAYRLNMLGEKCFIVSRVGEDELGNKALSKTSNFGLELSYIQRDHEKPTGKVQVYFDSYQNPDYTIIKDVAYDYIEVNHDLRRCATKADCICFGTLAQRSEKTRGTVAELLEISNESIKFLDVNLRKECYSKATLEYSLKNSTIVKANQNEAEEIAKIYEINHDSFAQIADHLISLWDLQYYIITFGKEGALVCSNQGSQFYDPGYDIHLVDSLGAGDAFSAGFIYQILNGNSMQEACKFGNIMGAIVATRSGATSEVSHEEIQNFNRRNLQRNIHSEFKN